MIDIENLTVRQVKEIASLANCKQKNQIDSHLIGKHVIVRTYSAGVHFGIFDSREDLVVKLKKTKRIWRWSDAFTLSEIVKNGLGKDSKISEEIEENILTQAIEVMACTSKCVESIEKIGVYKP